MSSFFTQLIVRGVSVDALSEALQGRDAYVATAAGADAHIVFDGELDEGFCECHLR